MPRAQRDNGGPARVSLGLPVAPDSVSLARAAAIGLLQNSRHGTAIGLRLAAETASLVSAGLARGRRSDRLEVHFDTGTDGVTVTVELRRRGLRAAAGAQLLGSRRLPFGPGGPGGRGSQGLHSR